MPSAPLPAVREPDEAKALGHLMADALGGGVGLVRDVHKAVAARTFGLLGMLGLPARGMHNAISTGAYATVRFTTSGAGRLAAVAGTSLLPPERRSLSSSPAGRLVLGALNGAIGDRLVATESDAATAMELRGADGDLPLGPRLAVFIHGLCETDEAWGQWPGTFGTRLRDELGYTPLQVRYNSGLHISDNGRALAELIEPPAEAGPVPVEEIVRAAPSMGALGPRPPCHYGEAEDCTWTA